MKKVKQFLDYDTTHPGAIVIYRSSNMIPAVHNDAYQPSVTDARRRAGGHFFMSSDSPEPPKNGAILNIAQIIKAVMY